MFYVFSLSIFDMFLMRPTDKTWLISFTGVYFHSSFELRDTTDPEVSRLLLLGDPIEGFEIGNAGFTAMNLFGLGLLDELYTMSESSFRFLSWLPLGEILVVVNSGEPFKLSYFGSLILSSIKESLSKEGLACIVSGFFI